jgi:hypothetical protein
VFSDARARDFSKESSTRNLKVVFESSPQLKTKDERFAQSDFCSLSQSSDIMTEDDGSFSVASGLPDESFSFNDSFSGADSAGKQLGIEDKQQDEIAGNDSVGVSRLRGMVVAMLLLTAALVITSTYIFLSREETDEFEKSVSFRML